MAPGRMARRSHHRHKQARQGIIRHLRQQDINEELIESVPDICYRVPCLRKVF
jgi:hypothetical protein